MPEALSLRGSKPPRRPVVTAVAVSSSRGVVIAASTVFPATEAVCTVGAVVNAAAQGGSSSLYPGPSTPPSSTTFPGEELLHA